MALVIALSIPIASRFFFLEKTIVSNTQNSASDASANVAPKLNLNATLSSNADRRSIPFTYLCIRDVGITLNPFDAMN